MLDISYNDLKQLLTEVFTDQLKPIYEEFELIHESISNLPTRTELNALRDDVEIIKTDAKAIKSVLKAHSKHFERHDSDIAYLKKAVA